MISMSDDDMEDYGFEYSDEDVEEEDVDIENQYYNSKGTSCRANSEQLSSQPVSQIDKVCCRHA